MSTNTWQAVIEFAKVREKIVKAIENQSKEKLGINDR
jgi:hypothetical protein